MNALENNAKKRNKKIKFDWKQAHEKIFASFFVLFYIVVVVINIDVIFWLKLIFET